MCGIVAFIGTSTGTSPTNEPLDGIEIVYEGIKILQNRGYDSCGISSISTDEITGKPKLIWNKCANKKSQTAVEVIGEQLSDHRNSKVIIGHSRWATTGSITDANAHPHFDNKFRVGLVHNGIIENYQELKDFLLEKNYVFTSQTDTEVIAVLIGYYLDLEYSFMNALEATIKQLEGTWGLAIICTETPNTLYLCKNGSPLVVGYDKNFALVASESSAILNYVKNYFLLKNNEIISISKSQFLSQKSNSDGNLSSSASNMDLLSSGSGILRDKEQIIIKHNSKIINEPEKVWSFRSTLEEIIEFNKNNGISTSTGGKSLIATSPAPYSHWMLKEIMEQPDSLFRTLNLGGRLLNDNHVRLGGLNDHREDLLKIRHLLILGCGTSYHAAILGSKYFKILEAVQSVQVLDASEFSIKDIPRPYSDVGILVLSQSGETKDVHRSMEIAQANSILVFSVVNVVGSLIAREASCGVYLNAGREVAVASTKSFTSQVLALSLIALWFAAEKDINKQKRKEFITAIRRLINDCKETLEGVEEQCEKIVPLLKDKHSIFILGRDLSEPIAYEGALKIKEIAYLHAQGYPGGSLKHGPFALIEPGTPIIILMMDDEHANKMEIAAEEVKARGATTILITNKSLQKINTKLFDGIATVPDNKIFGSLLSVIPLQYLSFILALKSGYSIDCPRNLAKILSVDG